MGDSDETDDGEQKKVLPRISSVLPKEKTTCTSHSTRGFVRGHSELRDFESVLPINSATPETQIHSSQPSCMNSVILALRWQGRDTSEHAVHWPNHPL